VLQQRAGWAAPAGSSLPTSLRSGFLGFVGLAELDAERNCPTGTFPSDLHDVDFPNLGPPRLCSAQNQLDSVVAAAFTSGLGESG